MTESLWRWLTEPSISLLAFILLTAGGAIFTELLKAFRWFGYPWFR